MSRILTVPKVAFDEAGNTGANLLDPDQPAFVLASVLATPEIQSIVTTLSRRNGELKFSRLHRSKAGRRTLLAVLNHEALHSSTLFLSGFHKRFLIVVKIVDLLYEPLAHLGGIDLYERGANLAMANMLYAALPHFIGPALFESMLITFVAMVREPSADHLDNFYEVASEAHSAATAATLRPELGALLMSRGVIDKNLDTLHPSALDPAVPSFCLHASRWTARLGVPFNVIHDASKPIENEQLVLEAMMSTSELPRTIGYDRRTMSFPFSATGIDLCDSASEPSLQVADVVASAAAYVLQNSLAGRQDEFASQLIRTRVLCGDWEPVWPSTKVDPAELGTDKSAPALDPHDHIGGYVSERLGGIPPIGQRRKSRPRP